MDLLSDSNSIKFLDTLKAWYLRNKEPRYRFYPALAGGSSFLLEPSYILTKDTTTDPDFKVQYIRLAGRRDLHLYKTYQEKTLPLSYYPDLNLEIIKLNPLLSIKDNYLYFKYEEYNGNYIRKNKRQGN